MFRSRRIRKLALCLGFLASAVMGAPIRPDEIADLLRIENQAKIEMSVRKEGEDTDDEDAETPHASVLRRLPCSHRAAHNLGVL